LLAIEFCQRRFPEYEIATGLSRSETWNSSALNSRAFRARGSPTAVASAPKFRRSADDHLKKRKNLRRYLHQQPCDDCVSNRNFVNVAPLQLDEEVLYVHSARLDEALDTAAVYLDARDLKSTLSSRSFPSTSKISNR